MTKDVVGRTPPVTTVTQRRGRAARLARTSAAPSICPSSPHSTASPKQQIIAELGDLIYHDPEIQGWQTADAYLSGNVRAKLAAAERAGPEYARNAEASRQVQPEDVLPGDIDANLGAPWIPAADIQAFAAELFRVEPSAIQIGHLKKDAVWSVEADYAAERSVAATSDFGTPRANGTWLLGTRAQHEDAGHLRHGRGRRPRRTGRQPGGDARRPREAEAHQGAVPVLGVRRSGPHRAARAALQRHLQQSPPAAVRRLAPRLPRHEPDDHAPPAPERTPSGAA